MLIMSAQRVTTTHGFLVGTIVLTFHLTCRKFERGCAMACQSCAMSLPHSAGCKKVASLPRRYIFTEKEKDFHRQSQPLIGRASRFEWLSLFVRSQGAAETSSQGLSMYLQHIIARSEASALRKNKFTSKVQFTEKKT